MNIPGSRPGPSTAAPAAGTPSGPSRAKEAGAGGTATKTAATTAAEPVTKTAAAVADGSAVPLVRHRRDGILPAVAGALSVRGTTWRGTGSRNGDDPGLHPLVARFLAELPAQDRQRHTGRCPETLLLSRFLTAAEADRAGRRAGRTFTEQDAREALRQARMTARHVREAGDPRHGAYAPPCRSCARLLEHFRVTAVDPEARAEGGEGG